MSKGKLRFIVEMALVPLKLFFLAKRYGKNTSVHIVGFYTKIAEFERLLMNIAHFCGNKVIYELRNGSMVLTYKEGNEAYRNIMKDLLLKPEIVLCQGQEYVDFIKEKWGVERSYYPNYIMDDFVKPNILSRPHPVKLIYFGRVTESKNIDVVIRTLSLIRNEGIEAVLEIIGGYNEEYKKTLDFVASEEGVYEYVTFYGRKSFDFIAEKLRQSHYFVFPSTEKQEGHSNSLTEAMGCGVVPIVSTAGFNASICGNPDLIVDNVKAEFFAKRIIDIEKSGRWKQYSEYVYNRIINNYTQHIVSQNLINTIASLW